MWMVADGNACAGQIVRESLALGLIEGLGGFVVNAVEAVAEKNMCDVSRFVGADIEDGPFGDASGAQQVKAALLFIIFLATLEEIKDSHDE